MALRTRPDRLADDLRLEYFEAVAALERIRPAKWTDRGEPTMLKLLQVRAQLAAGRRQDEQATHRVLLSEAAAADARMLDALRAQAAAHLAVTEHEAVLAEAAAEAEKHCGELELSLNGGRSW
jgi:hypothetical protein